MRELKPDEYRNRYTTIAPMPDALVMLSNAIEGMELAQFSMKKVLEECTEAIAYGSDYRDKFKKGELDGWTELDIARQDGECDLARRIIKTLGYEIDYYFCNWPKLKRIEGDAQ